MSDEKEKKFKVRAVRLGYYQHKRREAGAEFEVFERDFSDADGKHPGWMRKVLEKAEAPSKPAKRPAKGRSKEEVI